MRNPPAPTSVWASCCLPTVRSLTHSRNSRRHWSCSRTTVRRSNVYGSLGVTRTTGKRIGRARVRARRPQLVVVRGESLGDRIGEYDESPPILCASKSVPYPYPSFEV